MILKQQQKANQRCCLRIKAIFQLTLIHEQILIEYCYSFWWLEVAHPSHDGEVAEPGN